MCRICSENHIPNWKDIREKLKEFIHIIDQEFAIQRITLFGSFAKGDYHENSDIDLIIIGKFSGRLFDRIGKVLEFVPKGIEIEPFVYTPEEFQEMKKRGNPFILSALDYGIDLVTVQD
jgi:predicted nucleotidyltransferase